MNGGVEEIKNNTHNEMTHARATWDEWTPVCDHVKKEKQSKDAYKQTNKPSNGSIHSVYESLVDVLVSFYMLQFIAHVVGFVVLCDKFTCCQCTKLIHFLTCTGIPCIDSHCDNGLVKCCLYIPRKAIQKFGPVITTDAYLAYAGFQNPLQQNC